MSPSPSTGKELAYTSHIQRAARWVHSNLISSVPCSELLFLFSTSSICPSGLSATTLSGTMNYCQHSMFLHWKNLRLCSWEDQIPSSAPASDRGDSPHFGRKGLFEPPLQVLHVG